jgi:aryl-alcohol dehydrogenase-like predicted oxidoreductase
MDIYWVHNPVGAPGWISKLATYLEDMDEPPLIGVSNHNLDEIKQADRILKSHGLKLGAVQNHFSLLERSSEDGGILDWCRDNDVAFFAYMVLEQGALSGKYDIEHPMPAGSGRASVYNPVLDKIEQLNAVLSDVADAHGVSCAQIPVAWAIAKGCVPIVGVTKRSHVEDAVKAAGVTLSAEEMALIEGTAASLDIDLVRGWEKKMD